MTMSRCDVATLYRRALRRLPDTSDDAPPLPVPESCPATLAGLFGDGP
jgi:hypothetical protein